MPLFKLFCATLLLAAAASHARDEVQAALDRAARVSGADERDDVLAALAEDDWDRAVQLAEGVHRRGRERDGGRHARTRGAVEEGEVMTETSTQARVTVYTVGHGRHSWADFLGLLRQYEIEVLCDVRSAARSRWPQFNGQVLSANLKDAGLGYEWLPECGGKVVAPTDELNRGLERIMELAADSRVALMCSESRPLTQHREPRANCHRVGLLGPPLRARGARLIHILPDGDALEIDESSIPSIW